MQKSTYLHQIGKKGYFYSSSLCIRCFLLLYIWGQLFGVFDILSGVHLLYWRLQAMLARGTILEI